MIDAVSNLIGKGPEFPFNLSNTGGLNYSEGIARINQSLFIIFSTPKGSRRNLPEFGSDIYKYRFDPLDTVLMERIRYTLTEDIKRWEPRISLTSIEFLANASNVDNNILYVSITYHIINTTVEGNYVYPYQLSTYDATNELYN